MKMICNIALLVPALVVVAVASLVRLVLVSKEVA